MRLSRQHSSASPKSAVDPGGLLLALVSLSLLAARGDNRQERAAAGGGRELSYLRGGPAKRCFHPWAERTRT